MGQVNHIVRQDASLTCCQGAIYKGPARKSFNNAVTAAAACYAGPASKDNPHTALG
jgi:hypothetical protein